VVLKKGGRIERGRLSGRKDTMKEMMREAGLENACTNSIKGIENSWATTLQSPGISRRQKPRQGKLLGKSEKRSPGDMEKKQVTSKRTKPQQRTRMGIEKSGGAIKRATSGGKKEKLIASSIHVIPKRTREVPNRVGTQGVSRKKVKLKQRTLSGSILWGNSDQRES